MASPTLEVARLRLTPIWAYIDPVRHFVGAFVAVRAGVDAGKGPAIVVRELLENAVKFGDPMSDVMLKLSINESDFIAETTNHAVPRRVSILRAVVERVMSKPPEEALMHAMEQYSSGLGTSPLGLARLRTEFGAKLEVFESSPRLICVRVTCKLR